ncbi:anhydro-N-acetylmuramic acid kinase AnmK [Bacillus sp. 1P06AnD]|uniref:anhydro-N-acetylmuramic acid kinase AnmK n=1 Tax=Bacillus sp. 1P06AnD TaxID=3132208 RepID=UPI0039A06010
MFIVGLMSGTSLDGVDAALVEIDGSGEQTKVNVVSFLNHSIPDSIRKEILQSISLSSSNVQLICSLNFKLGKLFAEAVKKVCQQAGLPLKKLSLIGSHGQTIYHQPIAEKNWIPSTLQIGEPSVIAYECQTPVVSNFRTMDMAAGGLGAPLVPYSEYLLYRNKQKGRLLQNIGGIGNVTVLPRGGSLDDITAFDTGPGNMIIDEACRLLFKLPFDQNGELAQQGTVNEELLAYCLNQPYIFAPPPKTTGRELFGIEYTENLLNKFCHLPPLDIMATITMFTAKSIVENYREFIFPSVHIDEVIIGGGGSYNKTLIRMIQSLITEPISVCTQEEIGFSSEAKEAVAFAILANETYNHRPSNVPKATGAQKAVILGNLTFPI